MPHKSSRASMSPHSSRLARSGPCSMRMPRTSRPLWPAASSTRSRGASKKQFSEAGGITVTVLAKRSPWGKAASRAACSRSPKSASAKAQPCASDEATIMPAGTGGTKNRPSTRPCSAARTAMAARNWLPACALSAHSAGLIFRGTSRAPALTRTWHCSSSGCGTASTHPRGAMPLSRRGKRFVSSTHSANTSPACRFNPAARGASASGSR